MPSTSSPFGDVQNKLHIGIVVVVGSSGHSANMVGHLEVLGIGLHVLRSHHHHKLGRGKLFLLANGIHFKLNI